MDDKTIQRKLNQIAKLARELDTEAKLRYGPTGFLFMEPESGLFIMDGDEDSNNTTAMRRQDHIRFSTTTHCPIEAGGW